MMNKLLLLFTLFSISFSMLAQQKEKYSMITNAQELDQVYQALKKSSQTIQASFVQEKKMDIVEHPILSKGMFYFKQPNAIRIEYTSPSYYLVVMAAGKMLIKDEHKKTKIDTKGSKMFVQIQQIMTGIFSGQAQQSKDFKYDMYKSETHYKVVLTPLNGMLKDLLKSVEFIVHKSTMKSQAMTLYEKSGDVTVMNFKDVKTNSIIDEKIFSTR
jgi:outer membrane lipoprotein-sorting protein